MAGGMSTCRTSKHFARKLVLGSKQTAPRDCAAELRPTLEGVWGGQKWRSRASRRTVWLERHGREGLDRADMADRIRRRWAQQRRSEGSGRRDARLAPSAGAGRFWSDDDRPDASALWQRRAEEAASPKICRGEIRWCQGYSEPGSGSDLASLQTKAVRDGDDFVITGTKVWTSYADQADWIFALVRDDNPPKKQEGITFILIDMDDPGVKVSPILLISGKSPFCETHFTDVRVPVENVIHEIGAGWTVAKALLGHERTMIAGTFGSGAKSKAPNGRSALSSLAVERVGERDGRVDDPVVRDDVAQTEMDTRAFGLTVQRTQDAAKAGHQPGPESSMFKVYGTELNMRRYELMVRILGPDALGWEGEGFDTFALGYNAGMAPQPR